MACSVLISSLNLFDIHKLVTPIDESPEHDTVSFQNLATRGGSGGLTLFIYNSLMVSALAEEVGHLEFSALMPGRGIRCTPQLSSLIMPVLYGRSKTVPQG